MPTNYFFVISFECFAFLYNVHNVLASFPQPNANRWFGLDLSIANETIIILVQSNMHYAQFTLIFCSCVVFVFFHLFHSIAFIHFSGCRNGRWWMSPMLTITCIAVNWLKTELVPSKCICYVLSSHDSHYWFKITHKRFCFFSGWNYHWLM